MSVCVSVAMLASVRDYAIVCSTLPPATRWRVLRTPRIWFAGPLVSPLRGAAARPLGGQLAQVRFFPLRLASYNARSARSSAASSASPRAQRGDAGREGDEHFTTTRA